jgi:hypothetical protein
MQTLSLAGCMGQGGIALASEFQEVGRKFILPGISANNYPKTIKSLMNQESKNGGHSQ